MDPVGHDGDAGVIALGRASPPVLPEASVDDDLRALLGRGRPPRISRRPRRRRNPDAWPPCPIGAKGRKEGKAEGRDFGPSHRPCEERWRAASSSLRTTSIAAVQAAPPLSAGPPAGPASLPPSDPYRRRPGRRAAGLLRAQGRRGRARGCTGGVLRTGQSRARCLWRGGRRGPQSHPPPPAGTAGGRPGRRSCAKFGGTAKAVAL